MLTQRSLGSRLNILYLLGNIRNVRWRVLRLRGLGNATVNFSNRNLTKILFLFFVPGATVLAIDMIFGFRDFSLGFLVATFALASIFAVFWFGTGLMFVSYLKERRFRIRIRTLQSEKPGPSLVLQAQSVEELRYWLKNNDDLLGNHVAPIRSLLSLLRFRPGNQANNATSGSPLLKLNVSGTSMLGPVDDLLRVLKRVMEPPAKVGNIDNAYSGVFVAWRRIRDYLPFALWD
jgi:hypothetical protein